MIQRQESETEGKGVRDSPGIQLEIHVKIQETVCFILSIWDSAWHLPWDSGDSVRDSPSVSAPSEHFHYNPNVATNHAPIFSYMGIARDLL